MKSSGNDITRVFSKYNKLGFSCEYLKRAYLLVWFTYWTIVAASNIVKSNRVITYVYAHREYIKIVSSGLVTLPAAAKIVLSGDMQSRFTCYNE